MKPNPTPQPRRKPPHTQIMWAVIRSQKGRSWFDPLSFCATRRETASEKYGDVKYVPYGQNKPRVVKVRVVELPRKRGGK